MEKQSITVNKQEIEIVTDNGEQYVAIKPICTAIGVDYDMQIEKIKNDEILGRLTIITRVTGADGKTYKMLVLPIIYVFGWLFTINPKKVKPSIKQDIIKYKMECYHALFSRFTQRDQILKERISYRTEIYKLEEQLKQDERYKKIQTLKQQVKRTSKQLNEMDKNAIHKQAKLF